MKEKALTTTNYVAIASTLPHIPHGKDFQIPEEFKDFVAFDKGKDEPERFIIFALTETLLLLETAKDLWLGDGTFKQCLDLFYQLYTIHATIGG